MSNLLKKKVERSLKEAEKKLQYDFFWKKKLERRKFRKKEIKILPSQIERSFFIIQEAFL